MLSRRSSGDTEWLKHAACRGRTEYFFGPEKEHARDKRKRENQAAVICSTCPVRLACRDYARKNGEHGFWGGESEDARYRSGYLRDRLMMRRDNARRKRNAIKALEFHV